jgi:hypothetical protein
MSIPNRVKLDDLASASIGDSHCEHARVGPGPDFAQPYALLPSDCTRGIPGRIERVVTCFSILADGGDRRCDPHCRCMAVSQAGVLTVGW